MESLPPDSETTMRGFLSHGAAVGELDAIGTAALCRESAVEHSCLRETANNRRPKVLMLRVARATGVFAGGDPHYTRAKRSPRSRRVGMSGKREKEASLLDGACMDCGIDTMARDEYYMLKDPIWRSINPLVLGKLCLQCAEDRLGRPLHRGDFSAAPLNQLFAPRCQELATRLKRSRPKSIRKAARLSPAAIQSRLAKKQHTQNSLGRLSAALLQYRGRNGRVPQGTLARVLREHVSNNPPDQGLSIRARPRAKSVGARQRVNRGR